MNSKRYKKDRIFKYLTVAATSFSVFILCALLYHIAHTGFSWVSWDFLNRFPSRFPQKAGIKAAIWGSLWIMGLTTLIAVPLGVATAVYLQEYAKKGMFVRLLQVNIANLAGMPSIIYGLLGLAVFVRFLGLDRSILAGALTLTLLVLPVIIIASQEAIRAVPREVKLGAYALGARRWQTITGQILPAALPGIMTGVILSLSRAIGETAPLIMVGALSYVAFVPESVNDPFTVLPLQIFNWAGRPQEEFHSLAAAAIIVLLLVLFSMNFVAIFIRQRFQRYRL
ncbi:MAG: phosphate ABC transporter permease PstA [Pseudobdellovibrionaceae bacterium]|nr:phosphate ABC transporter permease PstA [Bdellovibrionales bacterium]USN47818.1 MAG: phosphate ABC transporter permease PstA [Pseudobdellovibrionaceae bacterium]